MSSLRQNHKPRSALVSALTELVEQNDRAALAALRLGVGKEPGSVVAMYPLVARYVPRGCSQWEEATYYIVASLFGLHQLHWEVDDQERHQTNFAASFLRLDKAAPGDSIERRFVALLNADRDALPTHLRQAVGLMSNYAIPVDWARLLWDIQRWGGESRRVQRAWARAYWGA
jgi:CRISPR system Cascade subunit CasB